MFLRGAQMADPNMTSALQMFRRAANMLARLEDAVVFSGQSAAILSRPPDATGASSHLGPPGRAAVDGLLEAGAPQIPDPGTRGDPLGERRVRRHWRISRASGHFGPFAVVLDQEFFLAVQTPDPGSLVLPQDRIIPFPGRRFAASFVHASRPEGRGGGAWRRAVELVVATDVSLNFLQVTPDPMFVFRVFEKLVLRIKEKRAIVALVPPSGSCGACRGRPRGAAGLTRAAAAPAGVDLEGVVMPISLRDQASHAQWTAATRAGDDAD